MSASHLGSSSLSAESPGGAIDVVGPEDLEAGCRVGDLDVTALSPAARPGQVRSRRFPAGSRAEFELVPFDALVAAAAEAPTLFVPLTDSRRGQINGRPLVSDDGVLLAPAGLDLLGSIPAGLALVVVRLDTGLLERTAHALGIESEPWSRDHLVRIGGSRAVRAWAAAFAGDGGPVRDGTSAEATIAELVVRGGRGRREEGAPGSRTRSLAIVGDVDAFAQALRWRNFTVSAACAAVGVSETRLRRAFQDVVGCPPKRFLTMRALNAARRDLISSDPSATSVSSIASAVGFWHFGRFSRDYRLLFGELPSATLRS